MPSDQLFHLWVGHGCVYLLLVRGSKIFDIGVISRSGWCYDQAFGALFGHEFGMQRVQNVQRAVFAGPAVSLQVYDSIAL